MSGAGIVPRRLPGPPEIRGRREGGRLRAVPAVLTQRPFPNVSELQVRVDGVGATSRHRDAVDVAVRESTGLVSEPRQFRDDVRATQVSGLARERALRGGEPVPGRVQVRCGR